MPRTDKEIAEYVRYYAKNNQRKWAVEMMTKTEGKTAEEIEHICNVENGKVGAQTSVRKPPKYSDEFLDAVAADRDAGMSYKDIADKYKMPVKTINSIMAIISHRKKKAAEPEMKQQEQAVKELSRDAISREPEAYPGQIYDDEPEPIVESVDETVDKTAEPAVKELSRDAIEARRQYQKEWRAANKDKVREYNRKFCKKRAAQSATTQTDNETAEPVVESDVKVFIPGELPTDEVIELDVPEPVKLPYIPYKKPEIIEPPIARACTTDDSNTIKPPLPRKSVWFAIRDELRDTAFGMFGHGTELIAENVHIDQHAEVQVRTPDGETIILTVRKVAYDN